MKKSSASLDIHEIERQLIKRKEELEDQLAKLHKDGLPVPQTGLDTGDQIQSVMQEVLNISLHDQEFQEYKKIVDALDRIKEGDYGRCIECGQAIAIKRLISFPDATRCIGCQEALEEEGEA